MSRSNEARHIKWHETCKCICRLDAIVCNNKQFWNNDKCRCECKELIDKGVCDKGYIWNPNNCECDKSCDIGEYLDYDSITLAENENSYKRSSCMVYTVLFWIFFTINVGGIVIYCVYSQWYLKKYSAHVDYNTHKEKMIY